MSSEQVRDDIERLDNADALGDAQEESKRLGGVED
jgi:hypothetical protein